MFLNDNRLTALPDSMAVMFTSGRLHSLEIAGNLLTALPAWAMRGPLSTNITSINAERNQLRALPGPGVLPLRLQVLRLGGNPIQSHTSEQRQALFAVLQGSPDLTAFSIGMAKGGRGGQGWDGLPNDYVVTQMPGLTAGAAKCRSQPGLPAAAQTGPPPRCEFVIKTDWNTADFASGGLGLHFCLNETAATGNGRFDNHGAGCGCEGSPPYPPACLPLTDNHDGTYTGQIDGNSIGARRHASFRFFQRNASTAAAFGSAVLHEVVVAMWADGTECEGGKPRADFQSQGGNCFINVEFEADCTPHGPFAKPTVAHETLGCQCEDDFVVTAAADGIGWQCNAVGLTAAARNTALPLWGALLVGLCALLALFFGVTAVRLRRSLHALQATLELEGTTDERAKIYE